MNDPVLEQTLKMIFAVNDKNHTLSLKDPKTGLTKSETIAVADYIIAKEAITVSGYPVEALKDAYIAITGRQELAV